MARHNLASLTRFAPQPFNPMALTKLNGTYTPAKRKWTEMAIARWICIAIYLAIWTFLAFAFGCIAYFTLVGVSFWEALALSAIRFYTCAVLSPLIFQFTRRLRFERSRQWLKNLLLHISVGLLFSATHSLIYVGILWMFMPPTDDISISIGEFYRERFFNGLYFGLLMYVLIVIAIHAFFFYQNYHEEERKTSLLKAQLAQSQLRALQMQLHPHFLFNALHSIGSLIFEDPHKANSMVARLGDFLRLTLDHSEDQMVTLGQELEFLRCYLEVEQVRFQDRLIVGLEADPVSLTASVPHLILQPIVENAVRHGISSRLAPGRIDIEVRLADGLLRLQVKDDGPGMLIEKGGQEISRQGRGLSNVRARLDQIYGDSYRLDLLNITDGGLAVIIEIPFEHQSPLRVEALGDSS